MVDYALVLTYHPDYAGRRWVMNDGYATLEMLDDGPKPSQAALDARHAAVMHQLEVSKVEAERRVRYQAETDGMFFAAQRDGGDLTAWKAAVDQIKADLPYPEETK